MEDYEEVDLVDFLRKRGVEESNLRKLEDEKIDCSALLEMKEEAMRDYIPAYGDRLAAVAFCRVKENPTCEKSSLIDKIKSKLHRKRKCGDIPSTSNEGTCHKGNLKKDRRVELGWLDFDEDLKMFKQVRSQNGGGTRQLRVPRTDGAKEILATATELFFPKGKCKRGRIAEYECTIQDFKGADIEDLSVSELYECTKVKLLRLYLCTKKKDILVSDNESENDEEVEMGKKVRKLNKPSQLEDTLPLNPVIQEPYENAILLDDDSSEELPPMYLTSEADLQSGIEVMESVHEGEQLTHTQPQAQELLDSEQPTIRIHRSNIQAEMMSVFKTPEIINSQVYFKFVDEAGADAAGVSREAYSAFWASFFDSSADGEDQRVPSLQPEYGLEEWQAVGRILVKGFRDHEVFPIQLAPAFMQALMFGEKTVSNEDLCESFLLYLSGTDRAVIKRALEGSMSDDDRDIFEEIIDREGCHSIPNDNQIRHMVVQLAHKCIIQNASYALTAMQRVVRDALQDKFPDIQSIQKMYDNLKPTHKKVIELIQATPKNKDESQALRYLNQFIRAQDSEGLANLLRFMTASSVMSVRKIDVEFKDVTGLGRRPIAHTCGPVLDLPSTYSSYREFRNEWQAILSSGYLAMDIM